MTDMDTAWDAADTPMYSGAEVSRLTGLHASRVRRWLRGYTYDHGDDRVEQPPVIGRGAAFRSSHASFLDLIDMLFVREFLAQTDISLQKLRRALDEARRLVGAEHFARRDFFADGRELYLKVREDGDEIIQLLSGGQWVIADIITTIGRQITFDATSDLARRWEPAEGDGLIALDPAVSFGRPHVVGTGIATTNVYDLYLGENKSLPRVCAWFGIKQLQAQAAVAYEEKLAA
jgi:uncharacterized protein (DUF433 family)